MARPRTKLSQQTPAIRTGDPGTDRALDAVREVVAQLARAVAPRATILTRLAPGLNKLAHGLGRAPLTFTWTTDEAGAVVSNAQAENPFPARQLWVRLSGANPANAVLLVYA